jgi:hypothetical protein
MSEIFKYFLYMRSQTPYPLAGIKDFLRRGQPHDMTHGQGLRRSRSNSDIMLKTQKVKPLLDMVQALDEVFRQLSDLLDDESPDIEEVALLLGPSLFMPREAYVFEVPKKDFFEAGSNPTHSSSCPSITVKSCLAQFFRESPQLFDRRPEMGPTNSVFMVKIRSETARRLLENQTELQSKVSYSLKSNFSIHPSTRMYKIRLNLKDCYSCLGTAPKSNGHFRIYQEEAQELIETPQKVMSTDLLQQVQGLETKPVMECKVINGEDVVWLQIRSTIKAVTYTVNNVQGMVTNS